MQEILTHAVADVIERSSLEKKLRSGRKLKVKLGVDPSSPNLHLGHYVVLKQLRRFADAGHKIIFLIGDATAKIGDPTGRKKERPVLSQNQIKTNVKTYLDQVSLVIDLEKSEIRYNSEWYDKMSLDDWLKITAEFTVNQILERDDFHKRLKSGASLSLHEIAYPVMQSYDSVMLGSDVELGGTDQRFNILAGRSLQRKMEKPTQDAVLMHLLVGTDGKKKMSKSVGNTIDLTDSAENMFGKVMSIPDSVVKEYARYILGKNISDLEKLEGSDHPKKIKERLAEEIVRLFHSGSEKTARAHFDKVVSKKETPESIKIVNITGETLVDVITKYSDIAKTASAARRLVEQGGVALDGETVKIDDIKKNISTGEHILKIGKRKFIKIKNKK